ncbi:uncharacterized protein I206_107662 [Kwoniella pini CBS 10737]|uniref:Uncharacterized protein n=1 Tax=Kwoniella pini CBS 10737 TaxID=1296096 RepID=A0A1B9HXW8_9TREE|nr:uncharacterized protein I206_05997 [Kwoniella pini CBS 10737]OCF48129.1 hypothetical protein I206_05997 [Kwoniella pini CBS 10737]
MHMRDHLQPIDLSSLPPCDDNDTCNQSEFTFSHLFEHTITSDDSSVATPVASPPPTPLLPHHSRWIGWTWEIPPDLLEMDEPSVQPFREELAKSSISQSFVTPARNTAKIPASTKGTIAKSRSRSRPRSERQALAELVGCVQRSARKQLSRRVVKSGHRTNQYSFVRHPQTPTPLSRDDSWVFERATDVTKPSDLNVSRPPLSNFFEIRRLQMNDHLTDLEARLASMRQLVAEDPSFSI